MARLTEEMVISRTRASDLSNIKKLNCWGTDLSDVSILRRMQNVEVLALSVNKIHSLSDFQYCKNLQELYVRKNNIRDLNQILYLQDLPKLKNLWLEENPCANGDLYRWTVLRALPNLQKLDNIIVQPEEIQDALRKGRELIHPDEQQDESTEQLQWPSSASSPECNAREQDLMMASCYEEYEDEKFAISQIGQRNLPQRHVSADPRDIEYCGQNHTPEEERQYYDSERRNTCYDQDVSVYSRPTSGHNSVIANERSLPLRHIAPDPRDVEYYDTNRQRHTPEDERHYYDNDRRNSNYDQDMYTRPPSGHFVGIGNESSTILNNLEPSSPSESVKDDVGTPSTHGNSPPIKDVSPSIEEVHRMRSNSYHNNHQGADSGSDGSASSLYNSRSRGYDEDLTKSQYRQEVSSQRPQNHRPSYPSRRPTTKNSNILSAVLCLIKELDYPSLEVVEMAVKSRIEEF